MYKIREILFRGQTRRLGERLNNATGDPMPSNWVYGGIFPGDGDFSVIYQQKPKIMKFAVYSDTVGQFICLTDKNKVKIFDGDIVKYGKKIGVVNYGTGCYCIKDIHSSNNPAVDIIFNDYCGDVEVIGNIFDNPELLEIHDDA